MSKLDFIHELKTTIKGEVLYQDYHLGVYATDASMYQIFPKIVVLPKDESDLSNAVKIASRFHIPILARGAGTSLAGQAVLDGMVLDMSKYFNQILGINEREKWAIVQPGVVRDTLNEAVGEFNLLFAPDPATTSRANIGGMIANNAAGTKSVLFGRTSDHVISLKVMLSDGTIMELSEKSYDQWTELSRKPNREGAIYHGFRQIVKGNESEILSQFPKVMRRVGGYCLDEFVDKERLNLAHIICGSEGTLALILEAKVRLVPKPQSSIILLPHFSHRLEAIKAVPGILKFGPSAVELIDRTVIHQARENRETAPLCTPIQGKPDALLIVEFYGNDQNEVLEIAKKASEHIMQDDHAFHAPIIKSKKGQQDVWTIRKKGLGLLIGVKSLKKPIAFIEDAAIPVPDLANYIEEVLQVCESYDTYAIVYAHASVGVLHVRPMLNLRDPHDIEKMKRIEKKTFQLVKKYKGSWSGEHGDGLIRSPFNEAFFGEKVYQAFREVKDLFDPQNLMNPGKIIALQEVDENLRYGPSYKELKIKTNYHFREEEGFETMIHMCSGVGECRKERGTMCPSFMVTRDELHSTRGRANALRLAISGQIDTKGLKSKALKEIMDLCISCKACKTECPSNVDMAKLKSEYLQQIRNHKPISLRNRLIITSPKWARRFSGKGAAFINANLKAGLFKWILEKLAGFDRRRTLPLYAKQTFTSWFNSYDQAHFDRKIILFADTYLNYHEPQIGISSVQLLNSLGIEVIVMEGICCQRPLISNGFLKKAKKNILRNVEKLVEFLKLEHPILYCEPSCGSAFTEDLPDLFPENHIISKLKHRFIPIEEYIYTICSNMEKLPFSSKHDEVLLHGHCHQKALTGTSSIKEMLKLLGTKVVEPDSGCCGMAGAFGYEKEHYEISNKMGERVLFKKIADLEEGKPVAACGFSCRHQIKHFTVKNPIHFVELFEPKPTS